MSGLSLQMLRQGQPFPRAVCFASVGAFGGLFLWLIYRAASKRHDGLASFVLGMTVVNSPQREGNLAEEVAGYILTLATMGIGLYGLGRFLRARMKSAPLADSDLA